MKRRPISLLLILCLLVTYPLLIGQGCGDVPSNPSNSIPNTDTDNDNDASTDTSGDGEVFRIMAVYGQGLIRLDDLSIWEVDLSSGAALAVGAQVIAGEDTIETVLAGTQYAAQRLGVQVRRSSIDQILNFGEVVELLDGSSWRVDGSDQAIVYGWFAFDIVFVVQRPTIGYLLIREVDGQYVRVLLN